MSDKNAFESYLLRMKEIPGSFPHPNPKVFEAVGTVQRSRGIVGDTLEIGSYQGQSAIVLGFLLQTGETLHICDPFPTPSVDDPDFLPHTVDWYAAYSEDLLLQNYLRFLDTPPVIHAHSSLDLPGKLEDSTFRFIHLDGSHLAEVLRSDLALARSLITPDGVIAVNLYRSLGTLEVAAAVWPEVSGAALHAVVATESHLYLTTEPPVGDVQRELATAVRSIPNTDVVMSLFRGVEVALVRGRRLHKEPALKAWVPPALLPLLRRARSRMRI